HINGLTIRSWGPMSCSSDKSATNSSVFERASRTHAATTASLFAPMLVRACREVATLHFPRWKPNKNISQSKGLQQWRLPIRSVLSESPATLPSIFAVQPPLQLVELLARKECYHSPNFPPTGFLKLDSRQKIAAFSAAKEGTPWQS